MTNEVTKPAAVAAVTKAEAPKAVKAEVVKPVKAFHKINGLIEPGTIFTPDTAAQRKELFDLDAVLELSEAEAALFASKSDGDFE